MLLKGYVYVYKYLYIDHEKQTKEEYNKAHYTVYFLEKWTHIHLKFLNVLLFKIDNRSIIFISLLS